MANLRLAVEVTNCVVMNWSLAGVLYSPRQALLTTTSCESRHVSSDPSSSLLEPRHMQDCLTTRSSERYCSTCFSFPALANSSFEINVEAESSKVMCVVSFKLDFFLVFFLKHVSL